MLFPCAVVVAGVMVVIKGVVVTRVDFETIPRAWDYDYPVCSKGQIKTTIATPTSKKNKAKIPVKLAIIKQHFEGF